MRAQREADAEFVCPLADEIRNDAVETDARQQQRHHRKGVEQDHREATAGQRVGNHLIHRLRSGDDVLAVLALYDAADRVKSAVSAFPAPPSARTTTPTPDDPARNLPERFVELRLERLLVIRIETPLLHVPDHADDLQRVLGRPPG